MKYIESNKDSKIACENVICSAGNIMLTLIKSKISMFYLLIGMLFFVNAQSSSLVYPGADGRLVYSGYANEGQASTGNKMIDFSNAGYKGGGVAIPMVPEVLTLNPNPNIADDHARIQAAINTVSALPLSSAGFRGAILLKTGNYSVSKALNVNASGVVIRGEGQGANGTVVTLKSNAEHHLFEFSGSSAWDASGASTAITDAVVPSGAKTFKVISANNFQVGQAIIVQRTPNQAWIDLLDMSQWGWSPGGYTANNPRIIENIQGNTITLNAPVTNAIETQYGGGKIYPYSFSGALNNVGIENIRLDTTYVSPTHDSFQAKAVKFERCKDAWARRVTARHFGQSCVSVEKQCLYMTIEDCAYIDPVSLVRGGYRYSFNLDDSSFVLFQRCYTNQGRHDFVTGSKTAGPNVFLDSLAENPNTDTGPHHRYAEGLLFDNIKGGDINVQNRTSSGSGHGWAGAQTVFWNCVGSNMVCDAPKAAMNFAIGCKAQKSESSRSPDEAFGIWESLNTHVTPRSLYYTQLKDRLGTAAMLTIINSAQGNGSIWTDLASWRGDSEPLNSPAFMPTQVDLGPDQITTVNDTLNLLALLRNPLPSNFPTTINGWSQVGGPVSSVISDNMAATTTVIFPAAGTYILRYSITQTDNSDAANPIVYEGSDTISISVAASDSTFDPTLFTSIGKVLSNTASLKFDTNALTVSGGLTGSGVVVLNPDGSESAVFAFEDIKMNNPPTIVGRRPFVLLSKKDMRINTAIIANGGGGGHASHGVGIAGGLDGGDANSSGSSGNPLDGQGPGGSLWSADASAGGGFGGVGGAASNGGGATYGDDKLTNLIGGSGAGGNADKGGGAGGGAIGLIAMGDIEVTSPATISANGGIGATSGALSTTGGGSGGGILIQGRAVIIDGNLSANGGRGGNAYNGQTNGGGGGGGRIAICYASFLKTSSATINVDPGQPRSGDGTGQAGIVGTINFRFKPNLATQWLINYTGNINPLAADWQSDQDGDGVSAHFEYAFGGALGVNDSSILPAMTKDGSHFTFNRRIEGTSPSDYQVQTSLTLEEASWTRLTPDESLTEPHPTLTEFEKVYTPVPQNNNKRFFRVFLP